MSSLQRLDLVVPHRGLEGKVMEEEHHVAASSVGDVDGLGVDLEQRHERLLGGLQRDFSESGDPNC
jgi:hypothetical protein